MKTNKYSKAAVEVLDILANTNKDSVRKIPKNFVHFLGKIADKNYHVSFNHQIPIDELDISEEAKDLLGFIYVTWWCSKEEFDIYKKVIRK